MKILFVGGTRFVGLAMAREAIARGHDVSIFHRSDKTPTGTETAKHLIGDRTKDFTALQTGEWDVVVDVCGYRPHEIHALYDVFAGRINKYVFISTVSVYSDEIAENLDETAQLADVSVLNEKDPITVPIDGVTYGPLKVLCEAAVKEHYPNHLIIRPTYVIGPDDYTNRFNFWVNAFLHSTEVKVPENAHTSMQYIDVRDLAKFTIDAIEKDLQGEFHTCSDPTKFDVMLREIQMCTNSSANVTKAAHNSESNFPLWSSEDTGVLALNPAKAKMAGLSARPLSKTIADIISELS